MFKKIEIQITKDVFENVLLHTEIYMQTHSIWKKNADLAIILLNAHTEQTVSDMAVDTERVTMNDGEFTSQVNMVRNTDFIEYQRDTLIDIPS